MRTGGFLPPIKWAVRGSAAGLYIMPRLKARRALTCGHDVHRDNFMCTCTTQQWFGEIRSAVSLTVIRKETNLFPCISIALCKVTVGVSYCLLELRMTH